jgi:multidrug efflux system membrane fusion protein
MPVTLHAIGNVEAASTVDVRSQVSGELLDVGFTEGQDVTAGQILFTLDPRPFELALKQAQAQLDKDTSQSRTVEAQRERANRLFASGLISQADNDTANAQANALKGTLSLDNVQIENAKLQLQYSRIVAPVSGRTGALLVHKGSLVRANDASPLVVINQIVPASVSFAVPARTLAAIRGSRTKLRAEAVASGSKDMPSVGAVNFIDNAVDPTSDTIRLKASFPNTDKRLWPGQFVEVALQLSVDEHAIVVPAAAVTPSQQGSTIFVVKSDQTVEIRPVTVARTEGNDAVIANGLQPGEVVVTDGQLGLTAGARVSTKSPPAGRNSKQP